jgi:hypothetical protein
MWSLTSRLIRISRGTYKLIQTPILINKIKATYFIYKIINNMVEIIFLYILMY